jgi:putative endonuclease
MKEYYVYILTNKSSTLYIGVTGNLQKRIWEHKNKVVEGFTKKYNIDKLIYFEQTENVMSALEREKQLKKWKRQKKEDLINKINPKWEDLYNQI